MSAMGTWWLTLGIGVVVIAVVALLLAAIQAAARRIERDLVEVWVVGPAIARNTAQIDIVRRIDLVAEDILATAKEIEGNAGRILTHAEGCPGCPRCVVGWGG